MNRVLNYLLVTAAALLLASVSVFAEDKQETDAISFESGTDSLEDASLDKIKITPNGNFEDRDIRRCRQVIGLVLSGKWEDLDLKEYGDLEPITVGDSITLYRNEQFIYLVADPSPAMNQLSGYELISRDGGASWLLNRFHRTEETGDMYIVDGRIVYVDGIGMQTVAGLNISRDGGKTYEEPNFTVIKRIMKLPSMEGASCYPKVREINVDKNEIVLDWYMNYSGNKEEAACFYTMAVDYRTLKIREHKDLSGLSKEVGRFLKTGYLFDNTNSQKLDRTAVSARLLKEYRLAGAKMTASEIRLAVNEIYARKGYDFKDKNIREYFDSRKWYKAVPGKTVGEEELSEIEQYNIRILTGLEKEYKAAIIQ